MDENCTYDLSSPVLLTGGAQRLGLYNAQRLLDGGQQVIVSYRTRHAAVDDLERRGAAVLNGDFATVDGIEQFIASLLQTTDRLRAIVHNASAWMNDAAVHANPAAFTELVNVHMLAPFMINSRCADLLLHERGHDMRDIVHMTDYAIQKGSAKRAAYVATKAGLESMTRSFAKRFAPDIKVNAIAPALIKFNPGDSPAYRHSALRKSAMGIEPAEDVVWQTLRFILGNKFLTGAVIPMDGGRHLV